MLKICRTVEKSIQDKIIAENFKELEEFPNFYVSPKGKVYKLSKNGNKFIEVATNKEQYGFLRLNLRTNGTSYTRLLHSLVYSTFRGDTTSTIVFLDKDKTNCDINNLVTVDELIQFYNENNKIGRNE